MFQTKFAHVILPKQNTKLLTKTIRLITKQQYLFSSGVAAETNESATNSQLTDAQLEWEKARPFSEMPTMGKFQSIRAQLPGGKYYKKSTDEMLALMQKEYGDAIYSPSLFQMPGMVITFRPNDFEKIFRNEGIWPHRLGVETLKYHREKHRADFFQGVDGLIATQAEKWGNFRSKVNPVLMQPKNVRIYLQRMAQVNQEFIEKIKTLRDRNTNELPANFEDYINRWTLESVSVVALDKHLGLLKDDAIDPMIQTLLDSVTEFTTLSADLDSKPSLWKYFPTKKFIRIMKALDNVLDVTSHYINETLNQLEQSEKAGVITPENEKSVLEKLLKIDRKVAIVMAMDMLMAGVETTTSTFSGIMFCLAKNPEKQAKLREEVRRILPNKDSEFTSQSINDMAYLRACIKESLRFYPLTRGNARMVQRDVVVNGYRVPKGTHFVMVTNELNMNEEFYPRANEFLPERWLRTPDPSTSNKCPNSLKTNHPFVYLPFGFGPRSCIGRRIAEMELELGVARIIRNFNVKFNYPTENAFKSLLVNVPNIPLKFEMTDVES